MGKVEDMTTKSRSAKRTTRPAPKRKWSARVTETSDALTLEEGVFKRKDPRGIARILEALSGCEQETEGNVVSIGHVDAHLLYQSGRRRIERD